MQKQKRMLIIFLLIAVVVGGGITYYFHYQSIHYVKTEDARIAANTVVVTPQINGKLIDWNVSEGDKVEAGDKLGKLDLAMVTNSVNASIEGLNQTGSALVSKAEVTAPISGTVIKSQAMVGQTTTPGQSLAIIADTNDIYISANIEETEVGKVKKGQDVELSIDALSGQEFVGFVDEVGQATVSTFSVMPIQSSNGNFTKVTQLIPIKIKCPEISNLKVVPGMNVKIKISVN